MLLHPATPFSAVELRDRPHPISSGAVCPNEQYVIVFCSMQRLNSGKIKKNSTKIDSRQGSRQRFSRAGAFRRGLRGGFIGFPVR
jgi:hypothetical protein